MKKLTASTLKKVIPYIVALVLFYIITSIYFLPLIQGKSIIQSDIMHYKGASKEILDHREQYGEEPLWTNSMFGGMPSYQIGIRYKSTILTHLQNVLNLNFPEPSNYLFLYFTGFYFLLIVLGVNPWLAIIGGVAFGFSSYQILIIEAGHNTKALAVSYMAPLIAGVLLTFRRKRLLGFIVTLIFLGLEIRANHFQITYYLAFIVFFIALFELLKAIKDRLFLSFLKSISIITIAAGLAILLNLPGLWSTFEYSKYTERGDFILENRKNQNNSGLGKDYITDYSYGIQETLTLITPNAKGGASGRIFINDQAMKRVDKNLLERYGQFNHYWGNLPYTKGPVYFGSIIIMLFVFGLFVLKSSYRRLLIFLTILSILLSWGENFMPLTNLFIDYIPLYNSFRAVSSILIIANISIVIFAFLTFDQVISDRNLIQNNRKKLLIAFGLTGGLLVVLYLFPTVLLSFISDYESSQFLKRGLQNTDLRELVSNLEAARVYIFRNDVLRSFLFILVSTALLLTYGLHKIKTPLFVFLMIIFIVIDLVGVNLRYLNEEDYVRKQIEMLSFKESASSQKILQDKTIFKVFNTANDPFREATTSFHHHSIGGYSAAKLRRYKDVMDSVLVDYEKKIELVMNRKDISAKHVDYLISKLSVLHMLNTKYIIVDEEKNPYLNNHALGNAWFISKYYIAKNANEELASIQLINPRNEVVIHKDFKPIIESFDLKIDKNSSIDLVSYKPNHLIYKSEAKSNQIAVFSEIYYNKGWNAYIDEEKTDYLRVNYFLRGMIIPQGEHKVEFKFEPRSYIIGNKVSVATSYFLYILIFGSLLIYVRKGIYE